MSLSSGRKLAVKSGIVVWTVVLAVALWAGASAAISTWPYNYSKQGCPAESSANTFEGGYPGCHALQVTVSDGSGHTFFEAGVDDTPNSNSKEVYNPHAGTVMVTPNGDGNAYGNENGQPNGDQTMTDSDYQQQSADGCPTPSDYVTTDGSAPQDPQGKTTDNTSGGCPQGAQPPVTGPGVGAGFDTHYQPFPPGQCSLFDYIVFVPFTLINIANGDVAPYCNVDPATWNAPNPSTPPTVNPWVSTGAVDTDCVPVAAGVSGPCALGLIMGGELYFGASDNLDAGEHDGVDGQYGSALATNGSSDGGSIGLSWQPVAGASDVMSWVDILTVAASSGSPAALAPIFENPAPFASAGGGSCADGICEGVYTSQQTLYQGCSGAQQQAQQQSAPSAPDCSNAVAQRDAYKYSGKDWSPYDCNSGGTSNEQACTSQPGSNGYTASCSPSSPGYSPTYGDSYADCGANYYREQEADNVTSEPGVMVYEDPDPEGSPALPPQMYPLVGAYVGTCGVVAGGDSSSSQATTPIGQKIPTNPLVGVNSAGQVVAADPTGC